MNDLNGYLTKKYAETTLRSFLRFERKITDQKEFKKVNVKS